MGLNPTDPVDYRALWDDYVTGTIRGVQTIAQSLYNVAQAPPDGFTSDELALLGDDEQQWADAALAEWNKFAGLSAVDRAMQRPLMLAAFRNVVAESIKKQKLEKNPPAGQFRIAENIEWPDIPAGADPPGTQLGAMLAFAAGLGGVLFLGASVALYRAVRS